MKQLLLLFTLLLPLSMMAQSGPIVDPKTPKLEYSGIKVGKIQYKRAPNLALGPSLIGLGGLLMAGSQVYLVNADNNVKTTSTILSAVGGASVFAGGIILGNALMKIVKQNQQAKIYFKGNSLCFIF